VLSQIEVARVLGSSERESGPLYIGKGKAGMLIKTKENASFWGENEPKRLNFFVFNVITAKLAALEGKIRTRKLVCY
jgi:hypothetical protein